MSGRDEFCDWARKKGYRLALACHEDESYADPATQNAWLGYDEGCRKNLALIQKMQAALRTAKKVLDAAEGVVPAGASLLDSVRSDINCAEMEVGNALYAAARYLSRISKQEGEKT